MIIAAAVLDLLDGTITNVAAPTIVADLHGVNHLSSGWAPATRWPWASCWWSVAASATGTDDAVCS